MLYIHIYTCIHTHTHTYIYIRIYFACIYIYTCLRIARIGGKTSNGKLRVHSQPRINNSVSRTGWITTTRVRKKKYSSWSCTWAWTRSSSKRIDVKRRALLHFLSFFPSFSFLTERRSIPFVSVPGEKRGEIVGHSHSLPQKKGEKKKRGNPITRCSSSLVTKDHPSSSLVATNKIFFTCDHAVRKSIRSVANRWAVASGFAADLGPETELAAAAVATASSLHQ